ncbi:uncharacterized protein PADG_02453 [Paracoccidioides brasiliensis Pb18]|uniref:Uncharacterized protein n=1 Tax=Paracoccidioides brasiliensis (strain Pb18) TaxID=502780 RepID=C1G5J8_PARBD|nr:uncharacterized protein PADG_02453 [Paracoccidioides brasiliensis Pb18]EEH46355.2 hypothetical protein PADG_02453 [Paracoccidioides brasiliensis Pb18]
MAGKSSHVRIAKIKRGRNGSSEPGRKEANGRLSQQDLRVLSEQRTHKRTGGWSPENGDKSLGGLNNGWHVGLMMVETSATEQIGAKHLAIGALPKSKTHHLGIMEYAAVGGRCGGMPKARNL